MQNNPIIWDMETTKAAVDAIIKKHDPNSEIANTGILYLNQVGLDHIWEQHEQNFKDMFKVEDKNSCAEYIKKYMGLGVHATHGYKPDKERGGFAVMYIVDEIKCLNVVISNRGFIVTAVPSKYNNNNAEMDNWKWLELLLTESTAW